MKRSGRRTRSASQRLERILDDGLLSDDVDARIDESTEKWTAVADELEIEDKGDFESLDEWWEEGVLDFAPMGRRVYEETGLAHRPA